MLRQKMLIRNFGIALLENLKFVSVENTLVISWLLNVIPTQVLDFQTNALTTVL